MLYGDSLAEGQERASSGYIRLCLLVNTVCALLSFGFFFLRDGGLLVIGRDFNEQQVVFSMFSNQMVRDGMLAWSPQVDIGSSFIGAMSFYNLGSPWFWCSAILPARFFPYIAGLLYVTKYAIAGAASFLFISRYVKNGHSAVLASMLYAFSGFQSSNLLFYHFHDVTALFPLLLIGLDELVLDKKRGRFALFVCINALVNYFFFIGEVLFLVLYYVVRFLLPMKREALAGMARCLAEGILGGAMGMALLLPSLLSVLQNPRATDAMAEGLKAYNLIRYLAVVRSVLLPGEMMSAQASLYPLGEWTSCSAYLPGIGIVLAAAFIIGRKKHWLSVLLIACAVIAMFPWLNGIFCLYSGWYCRWYYMPLLFAALASAAVIDEPSGYPVRGAALLSAAAVAAFVFAVTLWPMLRGREILVARKLVFAAQVLVALGGIACTAHLLGGRADGDGECGENDVSSCEDGFGSHEKTIGSNKIAFDSCKYGLDSRILRLYVLIASVTIATTASTIALYQRSYEKDTDEIAFTISSAEALKASAGELFDGEGAGFRVGEKNNNMLTMAAGLPSAGSFCSTVSGSVLRFYEALGLKRAVESPNVAGEEYLLSEAYSIERLEDADGLAGYRLARTADTYPIGFTYSGYMKVSELASIVGADENETAKLRVRAMLTSLVIRDEDEEEVEGVLEHQVLDGSSSLASTYDGQPIKGPAQAVASSGFKWNRRGFSCTIQAPSETFAFFSVPHDKGWDALVNGKESKIFDICGLMAVRLPEGTNEIRFVYRTPGLRLGIAVSAASWLLWAALSIWPPRRAKSCARSYSRSRLLKKGSCL